MICGHFGHICSDKEEEKLETRNVYFLGVEKVSTQNITIFLLFRDAAQLAKLLQLFEFIQCLFPLQLQRIKIVTRLHP